MKIPEFTSPPDLRPTFRTEAENFLPYARDEKTLSRPWAIPGTPGLEHRIGGLEKAHVSGNVSYDPANHDFMVRLRTQKVERITQDIPDATVEGNPNASLLVVGWGSTYGSIRTAVNRLNDNGTAVAHLHLRYLNPMPKNVEQIHEILQDGARSRDQSRTAGERPEDEVPHSH